MYGKINKSIVIFGGTGDLTYRKLMPALYNLFAKQSLTNADKILAIGRKEYTKADYISIITDWVKQYTDLSFNDSIFQNFTEILDYHQMDFKNIDNYTTLKEKICNKECQEFLFYYAVSPEFFDIITTGISHLKCKGLTKLVVEKPFGSSLSQAKELNEKLVAYFGSENIFRIDHYLGKEMVQNFRTLRFQNQIFKNSWDKNSIDRVDIIANENVGVETRASYYDKTGALKDMVQNHLMQILSIIAMEEPHDEHDIQNKSLEVFKQLRPVEKLNIKQHLTLLQYKGYKQEQGVDPESKTETFAYCKIFIDNERWENVPFYIKTGKRMADREMLVKITFKSIGESIPDVLIFKVQPEEGVKLEFNIKKPGNTSDIVRATMDFCQSCDLSHRLNTPEAYERLIHATLLGQHNLFSTWDQIYLSWSYVDQLREKFFSEKLPILEYPQDCEDIENVL